MRTAIEQDVQPRLNAKGSSGSYFARDVDGATIGIFKPKDEEPYGCVHVPVHPVLTSATAS